MQIHSSCFSNQMNASQEIIMQMVTLRPGLGRCVLESHRLDHRKPEGEEDQRRHERRIRRLTVAIAPHRLNS